jgi:hypothetical protein
MKQTIYIKGSEWRNLAFLNARHILLNNSVYMLGVAASKWALQIVSLGSQDYVKIKWSSCCLHFIFTYLFYLSLYGGGYF